MFTTAFKVLNTIEDKLKNILPDVSNDDSTRADGRAVVGGKTYLNFFNHESDLLICTTIVETGMDFSKSQYNYCKFCTSFRLKPALSIKGACGQKDAHQTLLLFYCFRKNFFSESSALGPLEFFYRLTINTTAGARRPAMIWKLEEAESFWGLSSRGICKTLDMICIWKMLEGLYSSPRHGNRSRR